MFRDGTQAPKRLRKLNLRGTKVSDEGVRQVLTHISSLRLLNLTGTRVTAAGVAALKKALPRCQVELSSS